MTLRTATVLTLLLCLTSALPALALSPRFDPQTMMPTSEIERGMKGTAKSVFQGVTITEFGVEVLAVLTGDNLGYDSILVRVLDGPVVERGCGVMGGMSGSPVYIGGRLVGAIATTWDFEQEPIAGVTAIDAMLQALDDPQQQAALSPGSERIDTFRTTDGPVSLEGRRVSAARVLPASARPTAFADDHTISLRRVAPPLYCSGLSPAAMRKAKDLFGRYGLEPVAGPGAATRIVETELVPGAALGVREMWGDFSLDTGGTVTWRDGDTILGFGHPYTEAGSVEYPICTSWVHDFVPCLSRTDKVMSAMKPMGSMFADRHWSVAGTLGVNPPSVPVTLRITDLSRKRTREFRVNIARRRESTADLVSIAAMSAISAGFSSGQDGTVRTRVRVKSETGQDVVREDFYPHQGLPEMIGVQTVNEACTLLTMNRFQPQAVTEVEFEAELTDKPNVAVLESLWTDQTVAKAGEELTIHARLRPQGGEPVVRSATLRMPLELEKGRIRIGAAGGNDAMRLRARLSVLSPVFYDLAGAIREYQSIERGSQILFAAGTPGRGAMVSGFRLMRLPGALQSVLESAQRTDVVSGGAEVSVALDVPWAVVGMAQLSVATEDREGKQGAGGAPKKDEESGEAAAAPPLPRGVPASLWWAATAFSAEPVADAPKTPAAPKPAEKPAPAGAPKAGEPAAKADEDDAEKPADKAEGDVGRKPSVWSHTSFSDFADADLHGLTARSDGQVHLACAWDNVPGIREPYVWSLAADGDSLWAGTLDRGCVYRIQGKEAKLLCDTGRFGVTALCPLDGGAVLAGTIPEARILRVAADGASSELCRLPVDYVWDIIQDGAGGFFGAGGPEAAVFRISAEGVVTKLVDLRHIHATRLLRQGDDLLIGTAGPGRLYRLAKDGKLTSLYDAGTNDITALAAGADGAAIVGVGPKGTVVAVKPSGQSSVLYTAPAPVMSVACTGGKVYAGLGDGGRIVEITDRDTNAVLRDDDLSPVTALCATGSRLQAGAASPGGVLLADLSAAFEGSLDSRILDTRSRSRWGRVDWHSTMPTGAGLALRVRAGNSADPKDLSWSPWSAAVAEPGREGADAPAGRFLQYRLAMTKAAGAASPLLDWVRITYLPENQRPTVREPKLKEGDAVSGTCKFTWKMDDPDKDKLQMKLLLRPKGKLDFAVLKDGLTKSEYEWNTKATPDGDYDLRLVVDDSLSNPADPEQAILDVPDVTVDNTPPEVTVVSGPAQQADGGFALTGFALDASCTVSSVAWKAEGEETWHAVRLDDGLYDWKYERFLVVTPPLKETVASLTLRARDAAGNVTDQVVKLERGKK